MFVIGHRASPVVIDNIIRMRPLHRRFDARAYFCHGSLVRRLLSAFLVIALLAQVGGPAIAACRMHEVRTKCCCPPAPANSFCEPDCCAAVKAARAIVQSSAQVRNFVGLSHASTTSEMIVLAARSPTLGRFAPLFVALHERAAPRIP